ncbi:MAG: hypothetical protein HXY53_00655 [Nitrospirae bacterium]|nr:hypothetical protein [Nitrospirota bacterium]
MRSQKINTTINNEKGIALMMVLVLSLIALAIVATLVYLVIQGTKTSGFMKRYESAREAGIGGAEIVGALISNRGNLVIPKGDGEYYVNLPNQCDCGDPVTPGDNKFSDGSSIPADSEYICICAKLCDPTSNWPATCSSTLDPLLSTDPYLGDRMQFDLSGLGTDSYQVSVKIVDTTIGNSSLSGEELGTGGVASSTSGVISAPPMPYLYRIEIDSVNNTTQTERSRLSVLYAY